MEEVEGDFDPEELRRIYLKRAFGEKRFNELMRQAKSFWRSPQGKEVIKNKKLVEHED